MSPPRRPALAVVAALALVAAAAPAAAQHHPSHPSPSPPSSAPAGRADTARRTHTAADARFMATMVGHHAQAIVMSRLAPTHGASPAVRTLAARIIAAQEDEIRTMQQWLREHGEAVPEPDTASHGGHAGHAGHGGGDHAAHAGTMPGMLSAEQLARLDAARGATFDELFLSFMIRHHQGAGVMVEQLLGSYGAAQDPGVFKFASDLNADQTTEIARMRRMLADVLSDAGVP